MSSHRNSRSKAQQQQEVKDDGTSAVHQSILVHGLRADRYRDIYHSVLQPSVLAALSSAKQDDYVVQVLELKQRLWTELSRPHLQETEKEDGRVEVNEIFDLT